MRNVNSNMNNNQTLDMTEKLSALSDILQLYNTYLNIKQSNNDDIMNELRKQDNEYFAKILKALDDIEKRLDRIEDLLYRKEKREC